eukprot:g41708.t1
MGTEVDGVDMRAEVGVLSRNIVIMGEMEDHCYGDNACKFFEFDTVGGHIKMGVGFKAAHIEGVELKHMGQQSMGHYPIHFHMTGDLDEKGGYNPPTYVKGISIHESFSRCVTIHGSNGLLVSEFLLGCYFSPLEQVGLEPRSPGSKVKTLPLHPKSPATRGQANQRHARDFLEAWYSNRNSINKHMEIDLICQPLRSRTGNETTSDRTHINNKRDRPRTLHR